MAVRDDNLGWLIRDPNNFIRGPFTHSEVLQLIKKGQLRSKTELSQANAYWFSVDEKQEMDRFFSDQALQDPLKKENTITKTRTLAQTQNTLSLELEEPEDGTKMVPSIEEVLNPKNNIEQLKNDIENLTPSVVLKKSAPQPVLVKPKKKSKAWLYFVLAILFLLATAILILLLRDLARPNDAQSAIPKQAVNTVSAISSTPAPVVENLNYDFLLRKAFLLNDLELVKSTIANIEHRSNANYFTLVAKAMLKRNFLFDLDGAVLDLNQASNFAQDSKMRAEINNLLAVYGIDKDQGDSLNRARIAHEAMPADDTVRYNLALAYFQSGNSTEAEKLLSQFTLQNHLELNGAEILTLKAWIQDVQNNSAVADAFYRQALERNPSFAKARLLFALHKLKLAKTNANDADAEFRSYIELMPDLEASELESFRKMSSQKIYSYAREQIRELKNPTAVVMAVDAMLSAQQNKLAEADKILDSAWTISPGNADVFKARAYLRWREAKYDEVVDLLKDLSAEQKSSPSLNMLLGMAMIKMKKSGQAIPYLQVYISMAPNRGDAWSLLGEAQGLGAQTEEAKKSFQLALKKNPLDLRALRGLSALGDTKILNNPEFSKFLPF